MGAPLKQAGWPIQAFHWLEWVSPRCITLPTTFVSRKHLASATGQGHHESVMRTTRYTLFLACALAATQALAFGSKYAGIYTSEVKDTPNPTTPSGPAFSISLGPDGSATVSQDIGKGAVTTFGHWTDSGSQITIKFDSADDKPVDPPMVLQPGHDGLQAVTWNHAFWGKNDSATVEEGRVELAREQETRPPLITSEPEQ